MAITYIELKNGETYSGAIKMWRPCFNWFTLYNIDKVFSFDECEKIYTPNERISINSPVEGEYCDEFLRAYNDVVIGRKRGWKESDADGKWKPYPKKRWKWEKKFEGK